MAACTYFCLSNAEGEIIQWILYFTWLAHSFAAAVTCSKSHCSVLFSLRLAGIPRESELYEKLEAVVQGHRYVIYGDPAYPLRPLLMKPYGGALVTRAEESFNKAMSTVRQAVEWGFGRIIAEFAFLDLKKKPENHAASCAQNV